MSRKSFKAGAVTAPLPPAMVTVGVGDDANVLTVAWTGILATVPPKTYISVRPQRHSHALLREHGEFVINLAPEALAHTVDFVGMYTGAKVDKFKKCGLTRVQSEHVGAPTIAECPIAIECRVTEVLPMGSHDVFIADILGFTCDESIIDGAGRICFERAGLIAYMHGEYFALGEKLGKFGFGTKRKDDKTAPEGNKAKGNHTSATASKAESKPIYATSSKAESKPTYAASSKAESKPTYAVSSKAESKPTYAASSKAKGGRIAAKTGKSTPKKQKHADQRSGEPRMKENTNNESGVGRTEQAQPFYMSLPKRVLKKSARRKSK